MRRDVDSNEVRTPTAKSLVLDLLSTMPPERSVPVGALVSAAALFGIGENNLRVGLARLRAQRLVESDERGSYRLGAPARAIDQRVRSWRALEDGVRAWDGGWAGVLVGDASSVDRADGRRRDRAFLLLGFRAFEDRRLRVRPDNLTGGVAALRDQLGRLGVDASALVFRMTDLDGAAERRARGLWNAGTIEAGYETAMRTLAASAARLPGLSREAAMVESFRVGGAVIRRLVFDPLLPAPIIDVGKRRALVEAMRRYDMLGRRCWKGWSGTAVALARSPGVAAVDMYRETLPAAEEP